MREASYRSQRVRIPTDSGRILAGIVEQPQGDVVHRALFAPCFTCTKDLKAIVRISRALAAAGIEVLRFDFTGLGDSSGDFSETTFLTQRDDLRAVAEFLAGAGRPAELWIGHSLGGAAVLSVAEEFSSCRAVATIATPSSTQHLAGYLSRANPAIEESGGGEVEIGGRRYWVRRELLDVLRAFDLPAHVRRLTKPLLILFSPHDETLPFEHARNLMAWAGGPTSLINLDQSDHLLVADPRDPPFVADLIGVWARRHLLPAGARRGLPN